MKWFLAIPWKIELHEFNIILMFKSKEGIGRFLGMKLMTKTVDKKRNILRLTVY